MTNSESTGFQRIYSEEKDLEVGVPIYRIVSYPSDPTLTVLHDKWHRNEIIIPPFQRSWVWSHVQASRLVESFLLGLPVPSIFVYRELSQVQVVIDGQQCLRTICGFFDGVLPDGKEFFLKGVSPQWEGATYATLDEKDRIRFRDAVLRVIIVEQIDPQDKTSIYHTFERLNTGGTPLTPQEVRNSTYHGPFNDLIVQLNRYPTWRSIFGSLKPDARMRDVELILRFFALLERSQSYTKPMKAFLNDFMADHQPHDETESRTEIFQVTVSRVLDTLGPRPFHIKRGINVAAFDSVMVAFARSSSTPPDIRDRFRLLLANPSYNDAITSATTDEAVVGRRIAIAQEVLFN